MNWKLWIEKLGWKVLFGAVGYAVDVALQELGKVPAQDANWVVPLAIIVLGQAQNYAKHRK